MKVIEMETRMNDWVSFDFDMDMNYIYFADIHYMVAKSVVNVQDEKCFYSSIRCFVGIFR